MGRLIVITSADLALGFQMAGVETFAMENIAEGETILARLLAEAEANLVVVPQELVQRLDPRLRRQLEASYRPVVMVIPGGRPAAGPGEGRRRYISELIRRAIGFHISFGKEPPPDQTT